MSSLFGTEGERWPLSRAVDAMVASARRAGFPALIWLAGVVYPSLTLGFGVIGPILALLEDSTGLEFRGFGERVTELLSQWNVDPLTLQPTILSALSPQLLPSTWISLILLLPVGLIIARLTVGLAQLSESSKWSSHAKDGRTPSLPEVWKAGAGLSLSTLGLMLTFPALSVIAVLFLLGPIVLLLTIFSSLSQFTSLLAILVTPVGLIAIAYGFVLQVLLQLALHSLARNRRGFASALTHAWRMVRNSPWGTTRAGLVDLMLQLSLLAMLLHLHRAFSFSSLTADWLLLGFFGVMRAGYWASTYEGLGGLQTAKNESKLNV
ncbi:MAG: hypothetical protein ACI8TQ_003327 [Planctomycetota bacterium]|jgi:hypothetical protein